MSFVFVVAALLSACAAQSCTYRNIGGTCVLTSACRGAYEPTMSGIGTTGCQANPDPKVQCCALISCSATSQASAGVCRPTADCAAAGGRSVQTNEGASGCDRLPPDLQCCFVAGTAPTTPRPPPTTPRPTPFPTPLPTLRPTPFPTPAPTLPPTLRPTPLPPGQTPRPTPAPTPAPPTPQPTPLPPGETLPPDGCTAATRKCNDASLECAPDGPNNAWRCDVPRTCRTLPCQQPNAVCSDPAGNGVVQCVVSSTPAPSVVAGDGCAQVRCAFNEECRPDARGAAFPGRCAPKQGAFPTVTDTTAAGPTSDGSLPLWVILVIAGVAVVLVLIICCVIAACVISRNRLTKSERADATSSASVGMYDFHSGTGQTNEAYPSQAINGAGNTFALGVQGATYTKGAYPSQMSPDYQGGRAPQTPDASAHYSSQGTADLRDVPAF